MSSRGVNQFQLAVERKLEPPDDFGFPFPPYVIQTQFMKSLFTALEEKKLGIFESPTGTGKSLSLLCGSLTWLQSRENERIQHLKQVIANFNLPDAELKASSAENWIVAQAELRKQKDMIGKAQRELKFMEELSENRRKYLTRQEQASKSKRFGAKNQRALDGKNVANVDEHEKDLEDLILNDEFAPDIYSDSDEDIEDAEDEPEFYPTRIIFASRTHSQLGQFANELKRTKFAKQVTTASLSSRQNLCINDNVARLKSLSLINERCLELQKGSKGKRTSETKKLKGCSGCPFFNYSAIEELKSDILSEPMDIEDLVTRGKDLKACPYYASRKAASKDAQLILLPYNTIMHSGTREGIGLKINNAVLLLDEAHNLIESISNMHSIFITQSQLEDCSNALKLYIKRYMGRFSAKNLLKLKQVGFILKSLTQYVDKSSADIPEVFSIQEFKVSVGIENLDFFELSKFIKKSKLIFKLKGYVQNQQQIEEKSRLDNEQAQPLKGPQQKSKNAGKNSQNIQIPTVELNTGTLNSGKRRSQSGQAILNFCEFFKSLQTIDSEGKLILEKKTLKFLLLNTADHFQVLVRSARSIILAGGTMKPYQEIEDQLFQTEKERIHHFSCDHVIPDENLVCVALSKGPSSVLYDFTYKNRNSPSLMEELSRALVNFSKITPGGLVCFLPSYDYETALYTYLKSSGSLEKVECRKKIFREPKDSNCDSVLTEYSRQIKNNPGGAALFAVVGGKLSEGINFSDALGRCIVVVGLPYPNVMSLEIKEKVKFVNDRYGENKGSQLLTNMCSKAVNQSIGRAIRHSGDYAAIVLVDQRYTRPGQQALLPSWISKRYQACDNFGQAVKSVSAFFSSKKK